MSLTDRINRALAGLLTDRQPTRKEREAQLAKGIREEMEHAATIKRVKRNPDMPVREVAKAIAKDHIKEDPRYYDKLEVVDKATKEVKQEMRRTKRAPKLKPPRIKLLGMAGKTPIYRVNATMVRTMKSISENCEDFTMGTNSAVWDLPGSEVWVSDELGPPRDPMEENLTILHELHEMRRMLNDGLSYDEAHNESLAIEGKYRTANGRGLMAALANEKRRWK